MPQNTCQQVYELSQYPSSKSNFSKFNSVQEDNVFADSYQLQILATSGSVRAGYTMTIDVGIDTSTEQHSVGGAGSFGDPDGHPMNSKNQPIFID